MVDMQAAVDDGYLTIRIHRKDNNSHVAGVGDRRLRHDNDNIGAFFYVVAVVLICSLSIVLMIASNIRKSRHDNQLGTFLKDMGLLREMVQRDRLPSFTLKPSGAFKTKPISEVSPKLGKKSETSEVSKTSSSSQEPDEEKEALNSSRRGSDKDSVFLLPGDFCIDMSRLDITSQKPDTKSQAEIPVM